MAVFVLHFPIESVMQRAWNMGAHTSVDFCPSLVVFIATRVSLVDAQSSIYSDGVRWCGPSTLCGIIWKNIYPRRHGKLSA